MKQKTNPGSFQFAELAIWLKQRTFMLYLWVLLLSLIFVDYPRTTTHVVSATLSRYMPSFEYLALLNRHRDRINARELREYEKYLKKVVHFLPQRPDAHGLLGFCQYYLGKRKEAVAAYENAVKVYRDVFNFHYNLGIIHMQDGDDAKAFEHLKAALDTDAMDNVRFISNSRMYFPFFKSGQSPEILAGSIGETLRDGYRQCYLLFFFNCERTQNYHDMLLYARQALAAGFPDDGPFYYYAGLASFYHQEYAEAVYCFGEGIKRGFEDAGLYYYLGLAFKQAGKNDYAVVAIQKSRELSQKGKTFSIDPSALPLQIF